MPLADRARIRGVVLAYKEPDLPKLLQKAGAQEASSNNFSNMLEYVVSRCLAKLGSLTIARIDAAKLAEMAGRDGLSTHSDEQEGVVKLATDLRRLVWEQAAPYLFDVVSSLHRLMRAEVVRRLRYGSPRAQ